MKKSRSRIIALLLSLVYCFTLATGVVFAEEVEEPAPAAQTREVESYTVTFDADGGTPEPDAAVVQVGHTLAEPTAPEKAGFIFTGWYEVYSAGGTSEVAWDFNADPAPLTKDLTLIAKYEKAYTITFDLNGGEYAGDAAALEVKVSEDGALPDAPAADDLSKEGYKFAGWYVGETEYAAGTPVTEDLTVVAKWDKTWNVTFNTDGGEPTIDPMVVKDGYKLDVASLTTEKTGFTLEKWIIQPGGETAPLQLVIDKDTELQAVWKANNENLVTLTFDSAGGTAVPAQTINRGTAPTKPEDPTREGKVFDKWIYEDPNPFDRPFNFDAPLDKDTLVVAKWLDAVTVTFDSNGGTPVKSQTIAKYDTLKPFENPTREGFEFKEWVIEGTEVSFDLDTSVTDNLTLVAKWQEFHVVTFDANGGYILVGEDQLPSQDVKIDDGEEINEAEDVPAAKRDGYTFKHWSLEGTDTKFEFDPNPIVKDITLVAQWEVNEYRVTFELDGGKWVETDEEGNEVDVTDAKVVTVEYNTLVPTDEMPADPVKEGFKFDGWLVGEEPFDANALITEDITVKPNWTKQVVVTFALAGGKWSDGSTEAKKVQVDKGKEVAQPENPTKDKARFDGWKTAENDPYNFEWPVREDITITAKWVDQAIIKFDTQGGSEIADIVFDEGGKIGDLMPENPTKPGYEFGGWVAAADSTEVIDIDVIKETEQPAGKKTYYAYWKIPVDAEVFTVTFDAQTEQVTDAIVVPAEQSLPEGALVVKPEEDPETAGNFAFAGWYDTRSGSPVLYDFSKPVTESFTLFAVWKPAVYVTFDLNGGTPGAGFKDEVKIAKGTSVAEPADPKWTDDTKAFAGWKQVTAVDPEEVLADDFFDFSSKVNEDITLKAVWDDLITISFHPNYGQFENDRPTTPIEVKIVKDTTVTEISEVPVREGYNFKGWTLGGTTPYDYSVPFSESKTLYAIWVKKVTVKFHAGEGQFANGANVLTFEEDKDTLIDVPADPTRENYKFDGWLYNNNPYTFTDAGKHLADTDYLFVANWLEKFTVTIDSDNGTEPVVKEVLKDETIEQPATPEKEGYTFLGWKRVNADGTLADDVFDFSVPIVRSITIKADWDPIIYKVTFDSDNGEDANVVDVNYGEKVAEPEAPVKEGFIFDGWVKEDGTAYDFDAVVEGDMTLKAAWTEVVTVRFNAGEGVFLGGEDELDKQILVVEYPMNGVAEAPVEPVRTGYVFKGWLDAEGNAFDFTQPITDDITLKADWAKGYKVTFETAISDVVVEPQVVEPGQTATEPEVAEVEGYRLDGWKVDITSDELFDFDTPIEAETTLYAVWTKLINVTFDANGGELADEEATVVVDYGTTVEEPAAPTKADEVFNAWLKDGKIYDFGTIVLEDTELVADWMSIAAPQNVVAVPTGTESNIYVKWDAVSDAEGYIVYRMKKGGALEQVGVTVTTDITDKGAYADEYNFYFVFSYKKTHDGRMVVSKPSTYTFAKPDVIGHVTNLRAKSVQEMIKVEWDLVDGADGYVIFRKLKDDRGLTYMYIVGADRTHWTDLKPVDNDANFYFVSPFVNRAGKNHIKTPQPWTWAILP